MQDDRNPQLAYSDLQPEMLDEEGRRDKARKIISILFHFLGRTDMSGLTVLDIGSSTGFIADEFRLRGATVVGSDIDVPGLRRASRRFPGILFACADGARMPFRDSSVDIVVFNHVYEHVVDPEATMSEIRRVLKNDGVAYLGFGNRLGIMEPHYKLPFLSWLPPAVADRYVRASGKASHYHERFRTRRGLRRLARGLHVWDYTYTVLAEPARFAAAGMVGSRAARIPSIFWRLATPLIPTYLWVGTPGNRTPEGDTCSVEPRPLSIPG